MQNNSPNHKVNCTKSVNMITLIVILASITVAASDPTVKTWTLDELSEAIETNKTDKEMRPHLTEALNTIMLALFTGEKKEFVQALIRSPDGGSQWTKAEIIEAMKDPATKPAFRNFFRRAFYYLEFNKDVQSMEVSIPALDISTWTLSDIKEARSNRGTHPDLLTYLEQAQKKLETESGKKDKISIVTPVGLIESDESNLLLRKY